MILHDRTRLIVRILPVPSYELFNVEAVLLETLDDTRIHPIDISMAGEKQEFAVGSEDRAILMILAVALSVLIKPAREPFEAAS